MAYRNERWLDHTGLNLIRIVIGSYFMAIALGLIEGVAPSALFSAILDFQSADLIGTGLLFVIAVFFMSGLYLRLTSLMLALFILCSSLVENFMNYEVGVVSFFWRDLTLACAVLMSYSTFKRRDLRKATLILRKGSRKRIVDENGITPRRVSPRSKSPRRSSDADYERVLRPLIAPTHIIKDANLSTLSLDPEDPIETTPKKSDAFNLAALDVFDIDEDCTNIFADV